ncbi:hypothetical protein F53441_7874 [Fusarium austroafricanum]|uniref:SCP domain-containing protein n=1 Tax=Fusarium austroafricanum TaxID=2364996 RepID=A0A8H4KE47_9HYPO|nr:hypothetical protein F53441_7874 [Fusarium austroafricanum]
MQLPTLYIQSSLFLATYFLSEVSAAPYSGKTPDVDADVDVGGSTGFGFLPETAPKEKISAENDYKVPNDYNKKYHIVKADIGLTQLSDDPAICYLDNDDANPDGCTIDADASSDGDEKRSIFARLFTRALTSDKKEALRLHNAARKKVKVSALTWDSKLESSALSWAKKMAKNGKLSHSGGKDRPNQGENLAYAWASNGFKNPITAGTKGWLNEKKYYHGETIPKGNFSDYGHYTQCVWKSSTKIGIATAKDSKGAWYTVARYSGPGNVVGQKPY